MIHKRVIADADGSGDHSTKPSMASRWHTSLTALDLSPSHALVWPLRMSVEAFQHLQTDQARQALGTHLVLHCRLDEYEIDSHLKQKFLGDLFARGAVPVSAGRLECLVEELEPLFPQAATKQICRTPVATTQV